MQIRVDGRDVGLGMVRIGVEGDHGVADIVFEGLPEMDAPIVTLHWTTGTAGDIVALEQTVQGWRFEITSTLTQYGGAQISAYLQMVSGEQRWHSNAFVLRVNDLPGVDATVTPPEPSVIDQLIAMTQTARQEVADALDDLGDGIDATTAARDEVEGLADQVGDDAQGVAADRDATHGYMQRAETAADNAEDSASAADAALNKLVNLDVSAETLAPGSNATVSKTETETGYTLAFGVPRGDKGDKGETGAKGDKGDTGEVTAAELAAVTSQLADIAKYASPAALWRKTASGNPVTCYPVPGSPLLPRIAFTATQEGSGDPSPENVRPIVPAMRDGGILGLHKAGKNLLNWNAIAAGLNTHAEITKAISGTTLTLKGTPSSVFAQISATIEIDTSLVGRQVILSGTLAGNQPGIVFRMRSSSGVLLSEINWIVGASVTTTVPPETAKIQLVFLLNRDITNIAYTATYTNLQLEYGSTPTTFVPYDASSMQKYTWTAPQDIYGLPGAETYVDWDAGELVVWDAVMTLNGTEAWKSYAVSANVVNNAAWILPVPTTGAVTSTDLGAGIRCNRAKTASSITSYNTDDTSFCASFASGNVLLQLPKSITTNTQSGFKAYLATEYANNTPYVIQYKRATPIRIPLTDLPAIPAIAQLDRYTPRQNVLTVDKGALTVGYAKSPIRESDELQAAIAALS